MPECPPTPPPHPFRSCHRYAHMDDRRLGQQREADRPTKVGVLQIFGHADGAAFQRTHNPVAIYQLASYPRSNASRLLSCLSECLSVPALLPTSVHVSLDGDSRLKLKTFQSCSRKHIWKWLHRTLCQIESIIKEQTSTQIKVAFHLAYLNDARSWLPAALGPMCIPVDLLHCQATYRYRIGSILLIFYTSLPVWRRSPRPKSKWQRRGPSHTVRLAGRVLFRDTTSGQC